MFSRLWNHGVKRLDVSALKLRHLTTHSISLGERHFISFEAVSASSRKGNKGLNVLKRSGLPS